MARKKKEKEMNDQSVKSLQERVIALNEEIFAMRNELSFSRKLEKPHLLREKRKEKARALTLMSAKQRSQEKAKGI
jgi:large subunit ribosomal protein L29